MFHLCTSAWYPVFMVLSHERPTKLPRGIISGSLMVQGRVWRGGEGWKDWSEAEHGGKVVEEHG